MFEKTKAHIQKHKVVYGTISGVVTGIGLGILVGKSLRSAISVVNSVAPVISPVFNNDNSTTFGGYLHKIVKCLETGDIYETVKDSADKAGVAVSKMSRHLNGHMDHVNGQHYEIIGLGVTN